MQHADFVAIALFTGYAVACALWENRKEARKASRQLVFVGDDAGRVHVALPAHGGAGLGVGELAAAVVSAVRNLMGVAWLDLEESPRVDGGEREVTATVRSVALTYTGRDGELGDEVSVMGG
jgi:hypothetical protein